MTTSSRLAPTTRHELRLLLAARPAMAGVLLAGGALAGPRTDGRGGLRRVPGLGWVTADPVVGRQVLTDHRSFTILGEGGVGHLWAQILGDWVLDLFDGPGHQDLRSRSRELFTEASAAALVEDAWSRPLDDARATLRAGGAVDVGRLARVLVGRMMISLLGIPQETPVPTDEAALAAFATGERLAAVALGTAGSTQLDARQVATARAVVDELTRGVPDGWRHAPADRLLGRCRELGLTLEETTGLASLLMVAGTETSASAMARTTALLVDTGEQHRLLARTASGADGSDEVIENVVREGLRATSPASVVGRGVAHDVEVAGRLLRAGERVMILTWSANVAVGPFRADRPYVRETRQLWFGAGRHLCLGAALARAEIAALLRTLWGDGVPLRVVSRRPSRRVLVPGYDELVVTRDRTSLS
ncbi:cytochrome P450 [Cellulosimicrobium cellulans]|uniref:cytochrome P450 n=1 Tax=Cellulosimicrobium cellulans TaxID=1710 RepID=UPI0008487A88|nr:cytochrome P450 [Cellulosimicrobium cellulans]